MLNNKKIPCVPFLLQDKKYVTDFKKKAELFNLFFGKQCSITDNSSELPSNLLSTNKLSQDLNRINNWGFQWKMSFNPDPSKQAQEVTFSRKLQKSTHPTLNFNYNTVTQSVTQKHLGMF